jgi:predicted AAA+ superfamily ATPase
MFVRNILSELEAWAKSKNRKPLVLRGARQVGKTTIVKEFGKSFDTFLSLNLEITAEKNLLESDKSVEDILSAIYLYSNKKKAEDRTLLFIDEIQNSPKAVALLRYFYEKIPEIHVIAAGSLLESMIGKHISFPVGRVEYMALRPCCFVEFLSAIGETEMRNAIEEYAVPEVLSEKAMNLFNTYTLIGGMPEVVSHYAENKDVVALSKVYKSLLTGYQDDVEKYAKNEAMSHIIRHILSYGWTFAGARITTGGFAGSAYKSREILETFRTLEKALLLELSYPTTTEALPLIPSLTRKPKLFWLDTGLVNYFGGIQKEVFGAMDITDVWRGRLAEQIVAQELLATNNDILQKRCFWVRDKDGSDAEVDFVMAYDDKLIPVEVKSGHNAKLKSLHLFMDKSDHNIAVRIWTKPFSIDSITTPSGKAFQLYNVPYYYCGSITQLLK